MPSLSDSSQISSILDEIALSDEVEIFPQIDESMELSFNDTSESNELEIDSNNEQFVKTGGICSTPDTVTYSNESSAIFSPITPAKLFFETKLFEYDVSNAISSTEMSDIMRQCYKDPKILLGWQASLQYLTELVD